ncbi:hypothetical protein ZIOFF_006879 [Zingiber officinale]|uniref:O-fucosyltransferase family protein n=1 Tax=Zingiber officinale TaxID=94328 RepID=A0A8J5HZ79_ZINOF|nr:hypothetical protein ZIOFF_006879 [Zingiber officinale]
MISLTGRPATGSSEPQHRPLSRTLPSQSAISGANAAAVVALPLPATTEEWTAGGFAGAHRPGLLPRTLQSAWSRLSFHLLLAPYIVSTDKKSELWAPLAPQGWKPCIESSSTSSLSITSNGFIQVFLDGGLNQQRMGVTDPIHDKANEYLKEIPEENEARSGKFAVLHLRFDKDMTAHSACDFGGGKAERLALAKYRQVIWQGRVLNSQFNNEELRGQGRCPLTPEEIGLLLAALGFDSSTRLYLASHKVFGGEDRISSLHKLFPLMEDKKSLASQDELAKADGKTSLLAAVDYFISMHADILSSSSLHPLATCTMQ